MHALHVHVALHINLCSMVKCRANQECKHTCLRKTLSQTKLKPFLHMYKKRLQMMFSAHAMLT